MRRMKRILLTTLYPFWFFLAKTWFGNVMMIPVVLSPLPILMYLILPDLMLATGKEAEAVGVVLAMLSVICSPLIAAIFTVMANKLEVNYERWGYKTEMDTKMS